MTMPKIWSKCWRFTKRWRQGRRETGRDSRKGQSTVEPGNARAAQEAWHHAVENMRGDRPKVIVEEFIDFEYEITLLTIRQKTPKPFIARS